MRHSLKHYSPVVEPAARQHFSEPCWKLMGCALRDCQARSNGVIACWRLSNTACANHGKSPASSKLDRCLLCPVFKLHAESDPLGWNHFLSDELSYLIRKGDETTINEVETYREILAQLPDGLLITDRHDRVHYVNTATERITGLPAIELIGRTSADIFFNARHVVEPKRNGETQIQTDIWSSKFEMVTGHGKNIFVTCITSPSKDAYGALFATLHILEDVTDRKRLEDDLKQSESKYRRLFEGSKDMIFIHSKGSIFKDLNQACVEMLGYGSKDELLSLASVERVYVNPLHRKVFQEQIDRFGFVKDFETTFKRKDGTRLHCLVSGNAVRDTDGKIVGYEAISKDITARMDGVRNLQQHNRELSLLQSVAVAMNVTQDLDEILYMALQKVLGVLNLDSGAIFLINPEKSSLVLKVQQNLPSWVASNNYHIAFCDQALMQSLLEGEHSLTPRRTFPPFKASLEAADDHASVQLICFLITAKERASGFIALELACDSKITDRDHQMLGSLGNFLGTAINNSCLGRTIRQHREELRGLTARLFQSQEEERKRIARELHDEAGQALTGISLALETILRNQSPELEYIEEQVLDIQKQINRTYQEMRRISHRLHPALLSELGLEPALESCLERISKYSQIEIDFKMVGFEERLDPQTETLLYRISQEAINNTLKHSHATHFRLSIIKSYPNIIFLAEDNGIGFDQEHFEMDDQALGLLGMRERASMVGGKFSLRTSKGDGKGTRIRIEIPIKESQGE